MIKAEVHTDDYVFCDESPDEEHRTGFDATAWFAQAGERDILDLAEIDWGGNYEADAVAEWSADGLPNAAMQHMFRYTQARNEGFECHVDGEDAMAWLDANRPDVAAAVRAQRKAGRA